MDAFSVILMVMDTMIIRPEGGNGADQFAYLASALERSAGVSGGPGKVRRGVRGNTKPNI